MAYVDGYVLPIPKKKLAAYKKMAQMGAKMWMKHGALDYKECVGDDLKTPMGVPMTKMSGAKASKTVIFAYVVFKSRKHRDSVNKKVMAEFKSMPCPEDMPFDCSKMAYGGFKVLVSGSVPRKKKKK